MAYDSGLCCKIIRKICNKCKIEKSNIEFGVRKLKNGKTTLRSHCKSCRRKTSMAYYQRGQSNEQIASRKRGYQKMYGNTKKGRAIKLLKSYRAYDNKKGFIFDLTQEWFIENVLNSKCHYCGTMEQLGAERKDNNLGHTKNNIVPCCAVCNNVRSDIFTMDEMRIIGHVISQLRVGRKILKKSGQLRLAKQFTEYVRVKGLSIVDKFIP